MRGVVHKLCNSLTLSLPRSSIDDFCALKVINLIQQKATFAKKQRKKTCLSRLEAETLFFQFFPRLWLSLICLKLYDQLTAASKQFYATQDVKFR